MGQSRNKSGIEFEKKICEENNWTHSSASPRLYWSGEGRYNFDKIKSTNLDPTKFYPISEKSKFEKYDAINQNGDKVEIKKYTISQAKSWKMYSEPIFKIANRGQVDKIKKIFVGDTVEGYNKFLDGVKENIGEDILKRITETSVGIQFIDGYVPKSNLEFKWVVNKSWKGFNRLAIMFRIKEDYQNKLG